MKTNRGIVVPGLAAGLLLLGAPAAAQEPPPPLDQPAPPPPPAPAPLDQPLPPPPGGFAPPGAPSVQPALPPEQALPPGPPGAPPGEKAEGDRDKEKPEEEVKDGVRARGGFSVNGGVMFLPNDAPSAGPSFGFAGRLGVQFNHYLGLVYQNTPIVTFTRQASGFKGGFADYNSFLVMLTLGHFLDIGAGPSVDFLAVNNTKAVVALVGGGITSETSSGVSFGAHGRVAFNIGGLSGNGPRRSGFSIGVDAHPLFTGAGKGLSLTGGFGAEWY